MNYSQDSNLTHEAVRAIARDHLCQKQKILGKRLSLIADFQAKGLFTSRLSSDWSQGSDILKQNRKEIVHNIAIK